MSHKKLGNKLIVAVLVFDFGECRGLSPLIRRAFASSSAKAEDLLNIGEIPAKSMRG